MHRTLAQAAADSLAPSLNNEADIPDGNVVAPGARCGHGSSGIAALAIAGLLIFVLAGFYVWSSHETERVAFNRTSTDYYALQVHGWAKGSLAMDVAPHPDLKVEYPNRIVGNAPYLLDASYYEGRYYLYFGPVPALLVLLPYHLATGYDLPEIVTASLFATAGLSLSVVWLALLITTVFRAELKPWAFGVCVLALGLANVGPATLVRPLFYEIAVTAGYAFTQGSLVAATLALVRKQGSTRWLACASLFAGLSVGSRPNLVVGAGFFLPILALAVWQQGPRTGKRLVTLFAAASLPITFVVAALLGYNYARFDRWLEFGNNLQLGANPQGFGFTVANFWHNLQIYYLTFPSIDWYFPFVAPGPEPTRPNGYFGIEEAHGQVVMLPVLLLAGVLVRWRLEPISRWSTATWIATGALGACALNFTLVASSGVRTNRYMMDFQPTLIVMAGLAFHAAIADRARIRRVAGRLIGVGLLIAALYNVLISFHAGQRFQLLDPAGFSMFERFANQVSSPLLERFGPEPGEQRWLVTFPRDVTHRIEPVLVAGSNSGHDALYLEFIGPGEARFHFEHTPHGLVPGPRFTYEPGATAEVGLRIGTLFPPLLHPWYGELSPAIQQQLRREVRVSVDGRAVFLARATTYPATLANASIGTRGIGLRGEDKFSGQLRPLPAPGRSAVTSRNERYGEFVVTLPPGMVGQREPLLSYGNDMVRMGDAIFIDYVDPDTIRFGFDSSGELAFSRPIPATTTEPLKIAYHHEPSAPDGSGPGSIRVWVNDLLVWAAPLWSRPIADPVWLPFSNPAFSASCRQLFTGVIHSEAFRGPSAAPNSADIILPRGTITSSDLDSDLPTTLVTWTQGNGTSARFEVRRIDGGATSLRLSDPLQNSEVIVQAARLVDAELRLVQAVREVAVFIGREPILRHSSPFFEGRPPQAWLGGPQQRAGSLVYEFGGMPAQSTLPDLRMNKQPPSGPVAIEVLLPRDRRGSAEPLLVAGVPGQADAVYIRYTDDHTVVFGFDHWGGGGGESPPIAVDYTQLQTITIDFDGLRPSTQNSSGLIQIHLNGDLVWSQAVPSFGYQPGQTTYGSNSIGLSTSEPRFTGVIFSVRSAAH